MGVQADLSIRGTTFEQTLVLVDGLRLNDPETGHLNLDLSLPLEAVQRIDVLHGSGSTFFGSDAIGGAVNLITAHPTHTSASLTLGGGNMAATEQHLQLSYVAQRLATRLTGARDTSDGFFYQGQNDRGFHSNVLALDTFLTPLQSLPPTEILLGASDRPYGANLFYGPYDSAEHTKGWLAAIRQPLPDNFQADFAYRKHTDEYILEVQNPALYENNHVDTLWQADSAAAPPPAAISNSPTASNPTPTPSAATRSAVTRATRAPAMPTSRCTRSAVSPSPPVPAKSSTPARVPSSPPPPPPGISSAAGCTPMPPPAVASACPPTSTSSTPTPQPSAIPT